MGKLIAREETVTTQGTAPSTPVNLNPTVPKDNKARILIDNKSYEVPLDRLGPEAGKFITGPKIALAAKP